MISIIIPVYNERKTLLKVLEKIKGLRFDKEVIIVDDHSTDGSRQALQALDYSEVKVFYHKKNYGKGRAVRTALENVSGDIVMIQDADLEYEPSDYYKLIEVMEKENAKVVYGSRFHSRHKARYRFYYIGNIFLSWLTGMLYNQRISDMETCYKLIRKEVYNEIRLKAMRFDFEPEITAKILKKGYRIYEVPISYRCRSFKQGKKISWKDGVKAAFYLFYYRFFD